jgi:hypothetical protein
MFKKMEKLVVSAQKEKNSDKKVAYDRSQCRTILKRKDC